MQKITITKENVGVRLDKFLVKEFFLLSRGALTKNIKQEMVKLNGKNAKPSHILKENDKLVILFSPEKDLALMPNKEIILNIIFEDEDILVINKPAGIQVHPSINERKTTIANGLLAYFPAISDIHDNSTEGFLRPGVVHRLDKDTSGIMIFGKNKRSFAALKNLFKKRLVSKKYIALVSSVPKEKHGFITKSLAKANDYKKQTIANNKTRTKIRAAVTEFAVLEEFTDCSLLEIKPQTGRMHQIRVHLASLGHPILGDFLYGDKKGLSLSKKTPERQLLHASELSFELDDQEYSFSAPLPSDFENFLIQKRSEKKFEIMSNIIANGVD